MMDRLLNALKAHSGAQDPAGGAGAVRDGDIG